MMDIKNINLKITQEQRSKILAKTLKNRRLFFIVFIGVALIYSFNVIYKRAYVELNFIEYPIGNVDSMGISRESKTLENIMEKIEERKNNLDNIAQKTYKDPFNFGKVPATEKEASGKNDSAAMDGSDNGAGLEKNP